MEPVTNGSTIDINWVVSDKNLAPDPIHLSYSTRKEGPWIQVARNLKNTGHHAWEFPRDQGGQFFVRLEASDLAAMLAAAITQIPLQLDMTEPQAQVVGINVAGGSGTPRQLKTRQGDKETRRQGETQSPCLLVSLSPCLLVSLSPCLFLISPNLRSAQIRSLDAQQPPESADTRRAGTYPRRRYSNSLMA